VTAIAAAVAVASRAALGGRATGARLQRMKKSPEWQGSHFENPQPIDRGHRQRLPERVPENDRDAAGEDHVHRRDGLSRPAEELAGREPPDLAEPADAGDLGGGKDREHLVEPRRQGAAGRERLCRERLLR